MKVKEKREVPASPSYPSPKERDGAVVQSQTFGSTTLSIEYSRALFDIVLLLLYKFFD